jgi:antirestriction protein ArdC
MNQLIEATLQSLLDRIDNSDGNWIKEWAGGGMPRNWTTNHYYRGVNILLLWAQAQEKNYPTNDWASYKQWAGKNFQVKQGERSSIVFIKKDVLKKGGEKENPDDWYRLLKCAFVFNAAQLESPPPVPVALGSEFLPEQQCEQTIEATRARIVFGPQPAYSPGLDAITLPAGPAFDSAAAYYCTAFHELVHWTGHKSRLDRATPYYAEEELVAEFGAAFLCAGHGIDGIDDNAAAYIRSWLGRVKGDRGSALLRAAAHASKAQEYILSFGQKMEEPMPA